MLNPKRKGLDAILPEFWRRQQPSACYLAAVVGHRP